MSIRSALFAVWMVAIGPVENLGPVIELLTAASSAAASVYLMWWFWHADHRGVRP